MGLDPLTPATMFVPWLVMVWAFQEVVPTGFAGDTGGLFAELRFADVGLLPILSLRETVSLSSYLSRTSFAGVLLQTFTLVDGTNFYPVTAPDVEDTFPYVIGFDVTKEGL